MAVTREELDTLQTVKDGLESQRKRFREGRWRDITRFCLPELDDGKDDRFDHRPVYSTAAQRFTAIAADALQGWAYGSSISWVRLALEGYREDDISGDVKAYLQAVENSVTDELRRSNFYDAAIPFTKTGFNLSTAVMLIDFDEEGDSLIFQSLNPWNCCLAQDRHGDIDCLMHDLWLDRDGALAAFGDDCPEIIAGAKQSPTEMYKFCKAIVSSRRYDLAVDGDDEWVEVIWYDGSREKAVSERRLAYKPFAVWRFSTALNGFAWGTGSPGERCLPDILALNAMEKSALKGVQLRNEPPIKATEGLAVSIKPNGITYLSGNQDYQYAQLPGSTQEIEAKIAEKEQNLREAYYVDFFLVLQQTMQQQKTATEASLLADEKSQIMASFSSRLNREFLEPVLEAVVAILTRYGKLPQHPEEISGETIRVDYISPLATAQRKAQLYAPARTFVMELASLAQVDPSVTQMLKIGVYAEKMADILNVPREILMGADEYEKLKAEQQKQAQEQMMAEQQRADADAKAKQYQAYAKAAEEGSPAAMQEEQAPGKAGQRMTGGIRQR